LAKVGLGTAAFKKTLPLSQLLAMYQRSPLISGRFTKAGKRPIRRDPISTLSRPSLRVRLPFQIRSLRMRHPRSLLLSRRGLPL
jgi:hypothetical protein